MTKQVKITGIIVLSIIALFLLIFAFLNCGMASSIAESVVKDKTGYTLEISKLRVKTEKHFSKIVVHADSVIFEDGRKTMRAVVYHPLLRMKLSRKKMAARMMLDSVYFDAFDSLNVRIRDISARGISRKDSIFTECLLRKGYVRFGSNRFILNDISAYSNFDYRDTLGRDIFAKLDIEESKMISTCFPLLSRIRKISLEMDNDNVFINELSVKSGTTDVTLSGSVGNLKEFIAKEGNLEVTLDILSKNVNVNEIVAGVNHGKFDSKKEYAPSEEENEDFIVIDKYVGYPFKVEKIIPILIPEWLVLSGDLNVDKALISVCRMNNTSAHLDVMDKMAKFSNCKSKTNFGDVSATIFYSSKAKDDLLAGVDVNVRNITAKEITTFLPKNQNLDPLLNSFQGKFSCKTTMVTQVDTALIPIPKTMKGVVNFKGYDMNISDVGDLRKYTSLLMFRDKNVGDIDNVNMYSIVSDSRVKIFPMLLGVDRFLLAMSGSHSFNNSFDYDISVLKSPVPFKFGFALHSEGKKSKVKFRFKSPQFEDSNLPTYYQEIDVAQKQLSSVINNVLINGVEITQSNSARITKEIFNSHKEIKATALEMNDTAVRDSVQHYLGDLDSLKLLKLNPDKR